MPAAGFNLTTLREEVREHCGFAATDTAGLSNAIIDRLINRAFWSNINSYPFKVTEKVETIATVDATRKYDLMSDFESIRVASIVNPDNGQHIKLERVTQAWYEENYNEEITEETRPTHYLREANCIKLYPTPDAVYTLVISYWASLDDLSDVNLGLDIPRVWSEILILGAAWRYFLKQKDYQNFENFQAAEAKIIASVIAEQAKDEGDSRLSGIELPYDLQAEDPLSYFPV